MRHLLRPGLRPGSRPRAARAALAVLAAASVLASLAPTTIPDSARAETTAEPGAEQAASPALVVAPSDPIVRGDTDEITFTVVLTNPADTSIAAGHVELRFDDARVEAKTGLDADRETTFEQRTLLAEEAIASTPARGEQTVSIAVPAADVPLTIASAPGVYRVDAAYFPAEASGEGTADGTADELTPAAAATTPLVWRGPGTDTVQVSAIVPIVLPSEVRTLPTRRQLTDAAPQWTLLIAEAKKHQATLAIDPRIIAAIRAYGTKASAEATAVLGELENYPHDTFLLQFADADPAAQAALGRDELLAPESLDFVSRYGEFDASATGSGSGSGSGSDTADPGATPSADPEATTPAEDAESESSAEATLPSLEELLAWDAPLAAWPAEGEVDTDTLGLLANSGIGTVVLDSSNVTATGGPRASIGAASAVITNAALGEAARTVVTSGSEAERLAGTATLTAELTLAAQDRSSGLVIGLDRSGAGDATEATTALLTQLSELSFVTSVPVSEQPSGTATLKSAAPIESRTELLRAASSREASVNEMGTVLTHPEYLVGYQRSRLLELFATRYAAAGADFDTVAEEYRTRDAELLRGVQAISTEHTQLVGASTRVPVQLKNSLPFDAAVALNVVPASAALSVPERNFTDVIVPADANERVLVPVRSRVSSGESGIVVSVTAASGEPTVYTGTLAITISTVVETVGLWVLGVLAALLLGFGIYRSVRRKRRVPAEASE